MCSLLLEAVLVPLSTSLGQLPCPMLPQACLLLAHPLQPQMLLNLTPTLMKPWLLLQWPRHGGQTQAAAVKAVARPWLAWGCL